MNIPTGNLLTLSRLSPLHHKYPSLLKPEILKNHEDLLSDALRQGYLQNSSTSDSIIGKEEDLFNCEWAPWSLHPIPTEESEARVVNAGTKDITGVYIRMDFREGTPCLALLLGPGTNFEERETYLPLLVTRMPASIRQIFITYLERTFDCRVGRWISRKGDIESALKAWLSHFPENTDEDWQMEKHNVTATFAFASPLIKGLKTFDITIPYADIAIFLESGKGYLKKRHHGWRGPFVAALGARAREKFAVDKAYEACVVHKIEYGGLMFGTDGKIRFPDGDGEEETQARHQLMEILVTKARGVMYSEDKYGLNNQI